MSDLKLVQVQEYNHQFSFLNRFDKENKQKKFACGVARCKKVFNTKRERERERDERSTSALLCSRLPMNIMK